MTLPAFISPKELAAASGFSVRTIQRTARQIGACLVAGRKMMLTDDDVKAVLEALRPCPSPSIDAGKSGTTEEPLPDGSYADLLKLKARLSRGKSRTQPKPEHGKVILMDRRRS